MKFTKVLVFILVSVCISLLTLSSCTQKNKLPQESKADLAKTDLALLESCSRIDTQLEEIWILLCRNDNHPQRQELYEYSKVYKTFRRLTYQDGIIQDLAVRDYEDIYYTSTYDAAKENFVDVLKGQKPGTDIYLKKRNQTHFERITNFPGQEKDPFWSSETGHLYFVQASKAVEKIISLDRQYQQKTYYTSKSSEISSPVLLKKGKSLFWLEAVPGQNQYSLVRLLNSKPKVLLNSASKIFQISPISDSEELYMAIATGLGREIWGFNPDTKCWRLMLRTSLKWDYFHLLNNNEVFVNREDQKGLQILSLQVPTNNCEPSPPGLGIEVTP